MPDASHTVHLLVRAQTLHLELGDRFHALVSLAPSGLAQLASCLRAMSNLRELVPGTSAFIVPDTGTSVEVQFGRPLGLAPGRVDGDDWLLAPPELADEFSPRDAGRAALWVRHDGVFWVAQENLYGDDEGPYLEFRTPLLYWAAIMTMAAGQPCPFPSATLEEVPCPPSS